jgi:hypothetical protein
MYIFVRNSITLYTEKALNGHFNACQYQEKDLISWVHRVWNHILGCTPNIHMGVRGYNNFVFNSVEDQNRTTLGVLWF